MAIMVNDESPVLLVTNTFDSDDMVVYLAVSKLNMFSIFHPSLLRWDKGCVDRNYYFDAELPADCHDLNKWVETDKDGNGVERDAGGVCYADK